MQYDSQLCKILSCVYLLVSVFSTVALLICHTQITARLVAGVMTLLLGTTCLNAGTVYKRNQRLVLVNDNDSSRLVFYNSKVLNKNTVTALFETTRLHQHYEVGTV